MKRLRIRLLLTTASILTAVSLVGGFATIQPQATWPNGTITMELQLGSGSGTLIDGATSWGSAFESALSIWNQNISRVSFGVVRDSTALIGNRNNANNVLFSDTIFGEDFGGSTLAVALNWRIGSTRIESNILFNTAYTWNSYRGNLRSGIRDFRRVAIHEAGHTLGLDHPDEAGQSVSAIMNAFISSIDTVTADDISGAQSLYGALGLTAPGAPTSFRATSSGSNVTLSWGAPTTGGAASGYTIEAGSSPGSSAIAFPTGSTLTTFSAPDVAAGSYFVRVKATNAAGASAASNEALLTVGTCTAAPGAPGALSIVFNALGTVVLSWTAASGGPTTYILEAGTAPTLANIFPGSDLGGTATSLRAPDVARGTYYVRMRARNTCGTGAASNEIVVTVL